MKKRTKVDLIILIVVLVAAAVAVPNATAIGDWWHLSRYEPPAQVVQLADSSGMNERGRKLFYRFSPQFVDDLEMTRQCGAVRLGCIEGTSIYILEGQGQRNEDQAVVTAAHEMLHIAYHRLSISEQEKINSLVSDELRKESSEKIRSKLDGYPENEYLNEAHSFVGSEMRFISSQLESHYKLYFSNRLQAVSAYERSPE